MGRLTFGVTLGLVIGIIDVLLMLPLAFPDERALLGSEEATAQMRLIKGARAAAAIRSERNVASQRRGPTRPGLQVLLEANGLLFRREFDRHNEGPRPMTYGMT